MSLSRTKTWIAGEVLTAADLNTEFNNILNNALSLISPLTGALDVDGKELIMDGDGDSSLTMDSDDILDMKLRGVDLFKFDGSAASLVNGVTFAGSVASSAPTLTAFGSDTNITINIVPKGTGGFTIGGGGEIVGEELISRTLASGDATIDITWTALRYSVVKVYIHDLRSATDDVDLFATVSTDGSTWDSTAYKYDTQIFDGASRTSENSTSASQWLLNETDATLGIGNGGTDLWAGTVTLFLDNNSTENPSATWDATMVAAGNQVLTIRGGGTQGSGTPSWEGLRFAMSSGNIAAGLFTAVGIR